MKFIITFYFICFSLILFAQDTLHKRGGNYYVGKIVEVNDRSIKMKLQSNPDGPSYVVHREDILKIVYPNGTGENFKVTERKNKLHRGDSIFGRNFISINLAAYILNNITISYERFSKSGSFSIKGTGSIGLNSLNKKSYYNYGFFEIKNKTFSTALDVYCYPFGQGMLKYFMGPSFEYGQYSYSYESYYPNPVTNVKGYYYSALFQNGFMLQPFPHLSITMNIGVGYMHSKSNTGNNYYYYYYYGPDRDKAILRGGINVGYRF